MLATLICGLHAGSTISGVGDFMMTTSILMFNAGDGPGTVQTFNVPIVNDDLVEGQEDINIMATIIGGSGSFIGGGTTATGAINIIDDDRMSWLLYSIKSIGPTTTIKIKTWQQNLFVVEIMT